MDFKVFSILKRINENVLGTRWAFTAKESPTDSIQNARLVVQGNYLVPGREFMET
jgi:hypothetical protein